MARALAALEFYRRLPKAQDAQIPGVQFLRCATAVPANYRAARRGRSRSEFLAKLGIVVEEADEDVGWLCAIFTASLQTARKNAARAQVVPKRR